LVPNVPCGVERLFFKLLHLARKTLFLMYRVELKVIQRKFPDFTEFSKFLMYRVELKENPSKKKLKGKAKVPNVPCGVESSDF